MTWKGLKLTLLIFNDTAIRHPSILVTQHLTIWTSWSAVPRASLGFKCFSFNAATVYRVFWYTLIFFYFVKLSENNLDYIKANFSGLWDSSGCVRSKINQMYPTFSFYLSHKKIDMVISCVGQFGVVPNNQNQSFEFVNLTTRAKLN